MRYSQLDAEQRKLVDTQVEELKQEVRKREFQYLTFGRFRPVALCVKCGKEDEHPARWCIGLDPTTQPFPDMIATALFEGGLQFCMAGATHDHMHRTCNFCGFEWWEKPLDESAAGFPEPVPDRPSYDPG